jgi:hypothetical protein
MIGAVLGDPVPGRVCPPALRRLAISNVAARIDQVYTQRPSAPC